MYIFGTNDTRRFDLQQIEHAEEYMSSQNDNIPPKARKKTVERK